MYNIKENLIDFLLFSYQKIVYGYFVSFYSRGQWAKQPRLCGYLANAARVNALWVQMPAPWGQKNKLGQPQLTAGYLPTGTCAGC